jgi:hydroxypyruvate isomerase
VSLEYKQGLYDKGDQSTDLGSSCLRLSKTGYSSVPTLEPKFMPQFAANLSLLYPELAFLDRFAAAARDGFKAVEFLFPYAWEVREIAACLEAHGLQQVLFNAPPGDWDAGERGLACLSGRQAEFRAGMQLALDYTQALACPRLHVMAGLMPEGCSFDSLRPVYVANLRWAAQQAAAAGVELLIEPINPRDMPRYFLNRQQQAHDLVAEVAAPNLKVQMDLYHCQIVEGDVASKLRQYLPGGKVGHIQIAGVPERHEPDHGELNYPYLFSLLDELAYRGWVGCEYRPARGMEPGGTSAGLAWLRPWQ